MEQPKQEKQTWKDVVEELLIKYNNVNIAQKMISAQLREAQRHLQDEDDGNKNK